MRWNFSEFFFAECVGDVKDDSIEVFVIKRRKERNVI